MPVGSPHARKMRIVLPAAVTCAAMSGHEGVSRVMETAVRLGHIELLVRVTTPGSLDLQAYLADTPDGSSTTRRKSNDVVRLRATSAFEGVSSAASLPLRRHLFAPICLVDHVGRPQHDVISPIGEDDRVRKVGQRDDHEPVALTAPRREPIFDSEAGSCEADPGLLLWAERPDPLPRCGPQATV